MYLLVYSKGLADVSDPSKMGVSDSSAFEKGGGELARRAHTAQAHTGGQVALAT